MSRNCLFWSLPLENPWFLISCIPAWISSPSVCLYDFLFILNLFILNSFIFSLYFKPITFGMREQLRSCSSSTAWGFLSQLIFLLQCGVVCFHLFYVGFCLVQSGVAPLHQTLHSVTRKASFGSQFLSGWQKFEIQDGVSNSTLRTCKVQNLHFLSRATCRLKNYFLMQSDLQLLSTNLFWAAKSEVPQVPSLHGRCADLWPNFWVLLITHCHSAGTTQPSAGNGRKWDLKLWDGIKTPSHLFSRKRSSRNINSASRAGLGRDLASQVVE